MQLKIEMNLQMEIRLARVMVEVNMAPVCTAISTKSFCLIMNANYGIKAVLSFSLNLLFV